MKTNVNQPTIRLLRKDQLKAFRARPRLRQSDPNFRIEAVGTDRAGKSLYARFTNGMRVRMDRGHVSPILRAHILARLSVNLEAAKTKLGLSRAPIGAKA